MDYLTDPERKQFEDMEQICLVILTDEAVDVHKDAITKFYIDTALLYTEIKIRASLEEMTVEERAYLGQKEMPRTTLVFMCAVLTKYLR